MKEEDASSTAQIYLPPKVQHITGFSEDVAGPPLAGQPCSESTGSSLCSLAPSPALAFSTEHRSHPQS